MTIMALHVHFQRAVAALVLGAAFASGIARAQQAPAGSFLVTNVRLFDGERTLPNTHVAATSGIIRAVGGDPAAWRDLPTIDGTGLTLVPGIIDAHVHLSGTEDLRQALRFGVTTVFDMASIAVFPREMAAIRARASASTDMSDVRSAGFPATSPSGHGTEYGMPIPRFSPSMDAREFVSKRRAEGSDYLKIMLNGVRSARRGVSNLDESQVRNLVDAAHAEGMLAVAHVETLQDVEIALAAGIDGLAHTWRQGGASRDVARRLAEQKVFVIPTLAVPDGFLPESRASLLADPRFQGVLTNPIKQHLGRDFVNDAPPRSGQRASVDAHLARVRSLHEAGVKLLIGSDAGSRQPTAHGIGVHREIELLAMAGLKPSEILAAATANAADAFRLADRGRIAPGLRADMILIRGDPTADVLTIRDIVRVWKSGVEVDRAAR
jgi:imidazolonepropionase-like amidohydrolase